jgi:AraC-like DNA-binding protein
MDKLSSLLGRCSFNARVFYNGDFCNANPFREDGLAGHLHLVRQGPVLFTHDDGSVLQIDEPAMVFYPRGTSHRLAVPAGATASLLCALISFQDGGANPLARMLPDVLHVRLADMAPMRHTLELLFAEAGGAVEGREVILDRLCDVLMVQVIRHEFEGGRFDTGVLAGLNDRHLAPVLDAMHARPGEPWQLQALASLACMSRARFTEHFRTVVGTPPIEYLTRWRMGLACRLLRKGLPVKVVSAQTGYTSAPAFTRAFTEHLGVSPRSWLRGDD